MKNLGQMMKQAQQMQAKMTEMQEKLSQVEVNGGSGGGMVRVTLNGKGEMRKISIDKALVDPAEIEVLEDLILAAFNDAKAKVEDHMRDEMAKVTAGMQLPAGLKLPF
ncbi:MAG: YbaB/EbfC family nucleoid-associated protein [Alphaproteobacteria bacterium]|nr:YbaB/EbfC family nucleoid-associated protein [Alphaproteobacteria bacterium]MBF0129174.1 YbaB/EbfC family nucleoid-associated protein [Alphaproteobacteria bacterium]